MLKRKAKYFSTQVTDCTDRQTGRQRRTHAHTDTHTHYEPYQVQFHFIQRGVSENWSV
jgi:hypothetical protein